jgi:hypothetical protein
MKLPLLLHLLRLLSLRRRRLGWLNDLQSCQLSLAFLEPGWQAMEQAQGVLRGRVKGHLVLELAPLLREGTDALVHPLVAVDLGSFRWRLV